MIGQIDEIVSNRHRTLGCYKMRIIHGELRNYLFLQVFTLGKENMVIKRIIVIYRKEVLGPSFVSSDMLNCNQAMLHLYLWDLYLPTLSEQAVKQGSPLMKLASYNEAP
jgi:hypothetical protein